MRRTVLIRDVRLGIKSLLLHKLRSFLTMLGVVFGVGSVIAMMAVGEGAKREALRQIEKLGSNNILITSQKPARDAGGGGATMNSFVNIYGLTYDDADRIEAYDNVVRTVRVRKAEREAWVGERMMQVRVMGITPEWFDLVTRPLVAGRTLIQRDIDTHAGVVVLTEDAARKLLSTKHAIGESVRIGSDYFEVVGIVRADPDARTPDLAIDAYIPMNVSTERFGEINREISSGSFNREMVELYQILVQVDSIDRVESTAAAIESMLKRFHKKTDYLIDVPLSLLRQAEQTQRIFTIVLVAIAGVSLLVGGIGIMNIMLATVTERTREIGVRRAIGAKRRQIIRQFLIEAVVLSTFGGLIGILLGVAVPQIIDRATDMPTVVSLSSIILSLGISVAVGIGFGVYPAVRASAVDPIVALRHE